MLRRFGWNLLFLGVSAALLAAGVLTSSLSTLMLAMACLGFAVALGTPKDGRYRVLAPHRSLIMTGGALFVTGILVFASSSGLKGLVWIVVGALELAFLAAMAIETMLIRLVYLVAFGQRFDFCSALRRGWIWMALPLLSVLLMAAVWMSLA